METSAAHATSRDLIDAISEPVIIDRPVLETILIGFLARGHVLLEDVPGTGKTLTARSLATALGLSFTRIQFTPDMLPADITGSHIFESAPSEFRFVEGPLFSHVILADELNRAPAKTQAALLEAMEENQVTVMGETRALPDPFFVIATQNPIETEGTFPLPEAQLDRFHVRSSLGYPSRDGERRLLERRLGRRERSPTPEQVIDGERAAALRYAVESVHIDPDIIDYILSITRRTREHDGVQVGISPRGTQRLLEAARAAAVLDGRTYVTPDDVIELVPAVLAHRLILSPNVGMDTDDADAILDDIIDSISVPTIDY